MEDKITAPALIDADFAVICKGDSMINARIFDGDIVYIRQQDTVESGEIAAVLIDGVVILRRVWKHPDCMILEPENPLYASQVFCDAEMERVQIIGKAVACTIMITDSEVCA